MHKYTKKWEKGIIVTLTSIEATFFQIKAMYFLDNTV